MLQYIDMTDLYPVNHYGLLRSPEEVQQHRSLMPQDTPDTDKVAKIIEAGATRHETVASFAMQNGLDALFES